MRRLIVFVLLAACASSASTPPADVAKVRTHLESHVTWPADRAAVAGSCSGTGEFSPAEEAWVREHLPDRTYAGPDEVVAALGL